MLDGIETGYEEKFDFPERTEAPRLRYMLASAPRTGSTFVSHLLWRSGCLGAPLEYLNFVASGPYGFAYGAPDRQAALWRSALRRRTSPNGVFGAKCFSAQLRDLQQANPALLREVMAALLPTERRAYVVRLKRRDTVAHAISYARAALAGVWHKQQEPAGGAEVRYSAEAVDHARKLLDQQEADLDLLLADFGVEPLTLWHEDVVARPTEAVRAVADYLEIALDPSAAIAVPEIEKQADRDSRRWADLYSCRPR
jgi:LPS sulfotransferase NodH